MNEYIDRQRLSRGFLTTGELIETVGEYNILLDVSSVLVSREVRIGKDNVFYPNVIIEQKGEGIIAVGDGNIFYPGTYIVCSAGEVSIGSENDFGPAGITVKANMSNAHIQIGDNGRYCDGVSIMGETSLGDGSQVLGAIAVQNCSLAGGGTFQEPNPDKRAAVLKGFGLARGVTLAVGQVVNGSGDFSVSPVEWQSSYHPQAKAK